MVSVGKSPSCIIQDPCLPLIYPMKILLDNPTRESLKLWPIIQEACQVAWRCRHVLWVWIFIGSCLGGFAHMFELLGDLEEIKSRDNAKFILFGVMSVLGALSKALVFVLIAVYCHRAILFGNLGNPSNLKFFFGLRERKYFAWLLGVYFSVVVLSTLIAMAATFAMMGVVALASMKESTLLHLLLGIAMSCLFYYVLGRWSLVFPAIAVDMPLDIDWSWKQTKGNGWRMLILVGFLPMIVWILGHLLLLTECQVFSAFLTSFVLFLFTPVEIAVLSIAFRELTTWTPSTVPSEAIP